MTVIFEMLLLKVFLSLILVSNSLETSAPIGNYPEHKRFGVNHPFCGLSDVPTLHTYKYDRKKCFRNSYPAKTLYDTEGNNVMYEERHITQPRIFKGIETELGEAPWTVSLAYSYKNQSSNESRRFCTGSLITFEWVLTAAHCGTEHNSAGNPYYDFLDRPDMNFYIFAGPLWHQGKEERKVSMWFPNPLYVDPGAIPEVYTLDLLSIKITYDMGLIKLDRPFTAHKSYDKKYLINTICLPTEDPTQYAPGPATFYGYGLTEDWFGLWFKYINEHDRLLKGYAQLNSYEDCGECYHIIYEKYNLVVSKTCEGDSGGPLVKFDNPYSTRGVLIGALRGSSMIDIEWESRRCSSAGIRNYWSPVPKHIVWILNTILDYTHSSAFPEFHPIE